MQKIKGKNIQLKNGETYFYQEAGQGPQVLFLHGNMSSSAFWDKSMEALAQDYHSFAPDLRGFGQSSYQTHIGSLWDYVEDLKDFMETLGLNQVHLVGWSLGGAVALGLVARYPKLFKDLTIIGALGLAEPKQRLVWKLPGFDDVLGSPWPETRQSKDPLLGYAVEMLWQSTMYHVKEPNPQDYKKYLDASLEQVNRKDAIRALRDFYLTDDQWKKIQLPCQAIHGELDRIVPYYQQSRRAQNCHVHLLDQCGHFVMNDRFETYLDLLKNFFQRQEDQ